mmetsp:Transcript_30867/g.65388  ORF Transcript_30867/g.65388 Transcript_30867/m.65388 type:complete len:627 (+) Transcript_30867:94-1974(+)
MAKAGNKSHNDSLQNVSTTLPSLTLSKDRSSLDGWSVRSSARKGDSLVTGGGSYGSYLADHTARLRKDIEVTTGALEREQRRLYKIDKDLTTAETEYSQKMTKYRLHASAADSDTKRQNDTLRSLERHLEKAIKDLNDGVAGNDLLREQIDQLRKEREVLNNVFKKLERGISRSNRELADVVSEVNEHRHFATDAQQKSKALSNLLERERGHFRDMTDHVKKSISQEVEIGREQDRGQQERNKTSGGGTRRPYMIADEEEAFSETDMFRRIFRHSFLNTIQRRHIRQHQKNIEVFEQAFATIKSSTGISDIEEIVKIFIALEQRNFSLLTYVNQLNREIESIEIRNKELQGHLSEHKKKETTTAFKRDAALSDLQAQITQTRAATKDKHGMIDESLAVLQDVRPVMNRIVAMLKKQMPGLIRAGYEDAAPPAKSPVPSADDENMNNHLSYIEEMVSLFRIILAPVGAPNQLKDKRADNIALGKGTSERPRDLPVAHTQGDDTDDEVEGGLSERVFTRAELRERANNAIQKRRRKPAQPGRQADGGRVDDLETTAEGAGVTASPSSCAGGTGTQSGGLLSGSRKDIGAVPSKDSAEQIARVGSPDADGEADTSGKWWRSNNAGHAKR